MNIQLWGSILANHMRLLVVAATGSSCRCRFLIGASWLLPEGNAQVSWRLQWTAYRGHHPDAKENQQQSGGPAEEKIDQVEELIKLKKQKQNKKATCLSLCVCAKHLHTHLWTWRLLSFRTHTFQPVLRLFRLPGNQIHPFPSGLCGLE